MSLKKELTSLDCHNWRKNKLINPISKYKIKENSKIYNEIKDKCKDIKSPDIIEEIEEIEKDINNLSELDCHNWRKNKLKNPISGYKIKENGAKYKELKEKCKNIKSPDIIEEKKISEDIIIKSVLSRKLNKDDCIKWNSNKFKNPLSNYTIKEKSNIYKELKRECEKILNDKLPVILKNKSPSIDVIQNKSKSSINVIENKSKSSIKNNDDLYYPDLDDDLFRDKLNSLYEFNIHTILPFENINNIDDFNKYSSKFCSGFDKAYYQYLMGHYISSRSPYKSLLIYHSVGVGKTCSAITISESFLISHNIYDEPKIWVIMPRSLKNSFKEQIFNINKMIDFSTLCNQCTGDIYIKLANINKDTPIDKINNKIKKLIKSRFRIFTYDGFTTFIETEYKDKIIKDKVIIIDEAHNIRSSDSVDKKIYNTLTNLLSNGINNRLILLSATPMYNEPSDIFDLLYLLLLNDKREHLLKIPFPELFNNENIINSNTALLLKKLSSNYISYLVGKNPFSFAFKLSPSYSDIKILDKIIPLNMFGKELPINDKNWLYKINDGIVPSQLGDKQILYLENNKKNFDEDINIFNSLQPMNIVYDTDIGEKGFYTFFNRVGNNEPISIKYNSKYINALLPDNEHLINYSGKLLNIANIIKNSNGIVVIYSRFIWSGILPMAIILEHLGFNREGTNNFLDKTSTIKDIPKYNNIKYPKYCILSSENPEIMGSTNIDNLLKLINSPLNIDGSIIKVILMTPVAGEGLSFFNIREMHLLEPWYHFNRVDQVIGRGIRNCSHQKLPLEFKNVTVFMHGAINGYDKETPDIHAFRIASRKLNQSDEINKIIRDNSLDCMFFKNINFFSKKIFNNINPINIFTSQNKNIEYNLGDDDCIEPVCTNSIKKLNYSGFREETFNNFSIGIKNKFRSIILNEIHNGNNFLDFNTIISHFINIDINIIMYVIGKSIYPYTLIDDYFLIPHDNGIHIVKINNDIPLKIKILKNKNIIIPSNTINDIPDSLINKIKFFNSNSLDNEAIIALYSSIDNNTFDIIIKKIITMEHLSDTDNYIAKCFYNQGVLISSLEIPSISSSSKYIGYCNIFNTKFEPILYINNVFKDCNDKQLIELISNRKEITIPDMTKEKILWGIYVPTLIKKDMNDMNNIFKILSPGSSVGKKTGINCTSLKKNEHVNIYEQLHLTNIKNTKFTYCHNIALELLNINRLLLYPIYKPTIL